MVPSTTFDGLDGQCFLERQLPRRLFRLRLAVLGTCRTFSSLTWGVNFYPEGGNNPEIMVVTE